MNQTFYTDIYTVKGTSVYCNYITGYKIEQAATQECIPVDNYKTESHILHEMISRV